MRTTYDVVMLVTNGVLSDSRVLRTARTAHASGLSVLLLGLGKARTDGELQRLPVEGPDVYLVPLAPLPPREVDPAAQTRRHRALLAGYEERVLQVCAGFTPRVIHSHDMTAIAAGGRLKQHYAEAGRSVPWIHDLHEWVGGLTNIAPPVQAVSAQDEARWIGSADVLTTVSPDIGRIIREQYELPAEPTVILNTPLVADFDPTHEPTVRDVTGLADEPLIVYCGQVKEARGVHELVSALALLPDVHAALVTSNRSAYVDRLVALAESGGYGHRLHLVPYVDQRDVASFLRTASAGVHTLARYGNGDVALPNKLFEYVHAQIPLVVSDCRAMSAFVDEHQIGASYRNGDVDSLARAVRLVLSERDRFRPGLTTVRASHTWEHQEDLLRQVYAGLLGVGAIRRRAPFRPAASGGRPAAASVLRVLHGPAGSANQPWTLAQALRRRGHAAANVVATLPRFGYRADLMVPWSRMDTAGRLQALEGLAAEFDIFHFHARSFYLEPGTLRFPSFVDLLLLRLLGKVVVFHFRGTEARLASEFERLNPFNYVADDPYGFSRAYPEHLQRKMIEYITAVSHATYVPDHELGGYVPGSEVVPRAIDVSEWPAVGPSARTRPLVVHAPTRSEIKGTRQIVEAVDQLKREGLQFDFDLIEGLSHAEAKERYRRSDIIVDQLRIGWYGVLAVEGMALGKSVVSYVRPDLVQHLGSPLPLAPADPSTVTDVLRRLVTGAEERSELGRVARSFVERVHSADAVAEVLETRYRRLLDDTSAPAVDFGGLAALLEVQLSHGDRAGEAMVKARNALRGAEGNLAQAIPQVKRSVRGLGERAPGAAESEATPALQEMVRAHKQVSTALEALETVLPATSSPKPAIGTTLVADEQPASSTVTPDPPRPALPMPLPPAPPVAPAPAAPPPVSRVLDTDRWGLASLLDALPREDRASWEAVGAATVRETTAGSALLDQLLRQPPDADRDAVARRIAAGTVAALRPRGDGLVVPLPGEQGDGPSWLDVKRQVALARHFRKLRFVLGREARRVSGGLLGAVLHDLDAKRPSPFARAGDDGTLLNDLSWFFASTARLRGALSASDEERYEFALGWFAAGTQLWSVEDWQTTRVRLSATLPIRWIVPPGHQGDLRGLVVRPVGTEDPLALIRRPDPTTGTLDTVETRLRTSIDRVTVPLELEVSSTSPLVLVVLLPRYRFEPLSPIPVVEEWQRGPVVATTGGGAVVRVPIPASAFDGSTTVTPFTLVQGRFTSWKLDRQIEQMQTLESLHPGRGFGARAEQWSLFRSDWAARAAA